MTEVLDPQTRVDELLFLGSHLIELLERENVALANQDLGPVREMVEQKTMLSRAYELRVLGMEQSGQDFSDIDPDQIAALKAQSERLEELVEINAKNLKIGLETGRRFMEVLADTVKTAEHPAGTYNNNGGTDTPLIGKQTTTASVAIDENL